MVSFLLGLKKLWTGVPMERSKLINSKSRVVSGARTTGALHLGHYHGVLKNWVALQSEHECFFFAADWHALTTEYENPQKIQAHTLEMLLDWLGAGLDPKQCTLFVQSQVPQHAELHVLLSMMTPLSWLERVPTYKEMRDKLKTKHLATYGFLGYPLLQAADILAYQADRVPVGEDQISHIELTREIARHFNFLYKDQGMPVLAEPQALLTKTSKMPGLDGQKMSKSYQNTIDLREDPESTTQKIKTMATDPARARRSDPGDPKKCPVFALHEIYSSEQTQAWVQTGCTTAGIGCLECKKPLCDAILAEQAVIRARAEPYKKDPDLLKDILQEGSKKARVVAEQTLSLVRTRLGLTLL